MATQALDCDRDDGQQVLVALLELRRAVASTRGRDQYVYRLLDGAIETGYLPAQQNALAEVDLQPDEVKNRIHATMFSTVAAAHSPSETDQPHCV